MEILNIFNTMNCKVPSDGSLASIAALMQHDEKISTFTESYRKTGSKTFKSECPLFAVACLFKDGRGRKHVTKLTGLGLVDFDHINPSTTDGKQANETLHKLKQKIKADPHTLMCYTTISGNGLRVIFRYELPPELETGAEEQHPLSEETLRKMGSFYLSAFFCGNTYYEKLLGISADMQCKNLTRLSGLAHDPDTFLHEDAIPFRLEETEAAQTAYICQNRADKQQQRIQSYYDTQVAPLLAKEGIKYQSGSHNNYVMRVGYMLAKRRFTKQTAIQWAKRQFADYADTEQVVNSCFANTPANERKRENTDDSRTMAGVEDIKSFLKEHILLRFNEITARVEHLLPAEDGTQEGHYQPISDRVVNSLWSKMSLNTRVNIQDMYRVIESDYVPTFNPFTDYLYRLPTYDLDTSRLQGAKDEEKRDYIRELAHTVRVKGGAAEQERWYTYLKKWLVGMVAAWITDNVVNNVILVLIGEQGSYKTTWFNYLLPPQLKQYFYTKTNANRLSKDDLLVLTLYGLVCCEELDAMRLAELNQLKAVVTMPHIDERAAYAHFHEHRQHIASFCGTGNNVTFLNDPSGNRRWLPFEVEHIRSPREFTLPYEGIYAQALALYMDNFGFWFTQEEIIELNQHNKHFETPRPEYDLVNLYFRKPTPSDMGGTFMTVARAMQIIGYNGNLNLSSVQIGKAFTELGFKRVRSHKQRGYLVVERTAEEIKNYQKIQALDSEEDSECVMA